jgi:hypothetical protein
MKSKNKLLDMTNKAADKKKSFLKDVVLSYKIPKLVKILWVDAYTIGGEEWIEKDTAKSYAKEPLPHMITVGFVLYTDNEQVALTNTIGPGETAQINKIPKRMIISIESIQ